MTVTYCDAPGIVASIAGLRVPKAIALAQTLSQQTNEYASLVECRVTEEADVIIFDVEAEVPQRPVHSINRVERIAGIFPRSDDSAPEVLALRCDFPRVPHLNLREKELPRSLCLYEERYSELKRRWTAPRFVERVRQWLALTAKGRLHQEDQPLEPLLFGYAGQIILPRDLLKSSTGDMPQRLYLTATDPQRFLIAHCKKPPAPVQSLPIVVSVHACPPQQHGIIHRRPASLAELAKVFQDLGHDLLGELRGRLKTWWEMDALNDDARRSSLVLVIVCPKLRHAGLEPETTDVWAFVTGSTLEEAGEKTGVWQSSDGHLCPFFVVDDAKRGEAVLLDLLNPSFQLDRDLAIKLNGQERADTPSIAAIGLGALGSQVAMNLVRSGFGNWVFIDDDRLMPHNLARHALHAAHVGWQKSLVMAEEAKRLVHDDSAFSYISVDVMNPREEAQRISDTLKSSDLILDMSASVSVERYLSLDVDSSSRRVSLFLTPTGDDLVLLAEDKKRELKLDELEMQYYRAIVTEEDISGHFKPLQRRRRYGQSCRDVTSTLPQDLVALHAAIASRAIREVMTSDTASITIWRADARGNVRRVDVQPCSTTRREAGDWTVCADTQLVLKLHQLREQRLPNETGGVLLGSFDLERRVVYIVDTIPSPPDSVEWPTLYIRGCKGLKTKTEKVSRETDGGLEYIGEWHSHPKGVRTTPSAQDQQVFAWLNELMGRDGLPALMMIAGDQGEVSCFIGEMNWMDNLLLIPAEG
ncbi:ThiF family adenylyltransferase [Desulforhabdus sp. TSK]|uniref:ThiF family adenylyltransferase n=1 Tax=Desulforhabdus sp. TSK TaxID=2925014 RepID=UPI001FC845E0|nr:ThiF family adenylyltransferase [Desulforhabdus sp. TSK]GKT09782.1 hypothetical protein DSTSK_30870 [Desulforhabdus sp. TSK]